MEGHPILKRSQHRSTLSSLSSLKFKPILRQMQNSKDRTNSSSSHRTETDIEVENRKQYDALQRKLAEKEKMKAGTRNFNKTFYTKMAKKIMQKPASFYKFGLRQSERSSCKTVFSELFKIDKWNFKGSLSVNDLWDNKILMKYLKENEMFFNKQILIKEFKNFDREQKQRQKQLQKQKQLKFVKKYRQWLGQNQKLNSNNISYQEMKQMDTNQACSYIRSQIERLNAANGKNYRIRTKSRKIMDVLERNHDRFDKIAGKFKENMILLL